jgi:hypothetical protein
MTSSEIAYRLEEAARGSRRLLDRLLEVQSAHRASLERCIELARENALLRQRLAADGQ